MTPDELVGRLVGLFPDCATHGDAPGNPSREADG